MLGVLSTANSGTGVNAWVAGDDEEMQPFVPIEELFKGRHTLTDRSSFVRELVRELQTELAGSGNHDGGLG
jgi:hypothetical protein